jgi:hypothetical protein
MQHHLSTHRTGDINLFAACMAIGIEPCFAEPAEIIQSDDGKDYLSFRLNSTSRCGQYSTQEMCGAWKHPESFKREFPSHPFNVIMDFSRYSKGARTVADWIEKAASFLEISRDSVRKDLRLVANMKDDLPLSPLSYVLCYIVFRWESVAMVKQMIPKTFITAGASIVMLDGNLPKRKQLQILSYL